FADATALAGATALPISTAMMTFVPGGNLSTATCTVTLSCASARTLPVVHAIASAQTIPVTSLFIGCLLLAGCRHIRVHQNCLNVLPSSGRRIRDRLSHRGCPVALQRRRCFLRALEPGVAECFLIPVLD